MTNSPLSGDARTRAADLYDTFASAVWVRLRGRYRGVDEQAVADAVVRAVLDVAADPGLVPPDVPPARVLLSRARQRLRVTLRGDGRRKRREREYAAAAVTAERTAGPCPVSVAAGREEAGRLRDRVAPTLAEQRALDLWLVGVTDPADLAARLGLSAAAAATLLARFRQRVRRERLKRGEQEDGP